MKTKIIAIIILLIISLLLASGCIQKQENKETDNSQLNQTNNSIKIKLKITDSQNKTIAEKYVAGEKEQNLFEILLKSDINFNYKKYAYGAFITEIEGLKPKNNEYIAIYINEKYSDKGVSSITPKNNDIIEFKLEKIETPNQN
jgi:outer membrane lipoprotein-sorting protein